MYHRMNLNGHYFTYFWASRNTAVNNDNSGKLFTAPFAVAEDYCRDWRVSSRKDMIAPELVTYWEKDDVL